MTSTLANELVTVHNHWESQHSGRLWSLVEYVPIDGRVPRLYRSHKLDSVSLKKKTLIWEGRKRYRSERHWENGCEYDQNMLDDIVKE